MWLFHALHDESTADVAAHCGRIIDKQWYSGTERLGKRQAGLWHRKQFLARIGRISKRKSAGSYTAQHLAHPVAALQSAAAANARNW
jgi:hypothetical protein